MIFLANAVLSASFGQWPLATVQLGAAVMATAAAAQADHKASGGNSRSGVTGGRSRR